MGLSYKEDTQQAQERLAAFWANECIGRPAICITAPRHKPLPGPDTPPAPPKVEQRWTDCTYRIAAADAALRATFFGGEALPHFWPNLGPGWLATFYGSEPTFQEETVWFGPVEADWQRYDIAFDPASPRWELAKQLLRQAQAHFAGQALTGMVDLGGVTDILDSLRGTPELLQDMTDPALERAIQRARDDICTTWRRCYAELFALADGPRLGSIDWAAVWAPGKMYSIQSDMSCMISPELFARFVAPELEALCGFLDYPLYHLDGPGAVKHLDRLLAIRRLRAIQWIPGAGAPSALDWLPLLRHIQAAGKALDVYESVEGVERLVRELRPEGLLIHTSTKTEQEARDLLRLAEVWAGAR